MTCTEAQLKRIQIIYFGQEIGYKNKNIYQQLPFFWKERKYEYRPEVITKLGFVILERGRTRTLRQRAEKTPEVKEK